MNQCAVFIFLFMSEKGYVNSQPNCVTKSKRLSLFMSHNVPTLDSSINTESSQVMWLSFVVRNQVQRAAPFTLMV